MPEAAPQRWMGEQKSLCQPVNCENVAAQGSKDPQAQNGLCRFGLPDSHAMACENFQRKTLCVLTHYQRVSATLCGFIFFFVNSYEVVKNLKDEISNEVYHCNVKTGI